MSLKESASILAPLHVLWPDRPDQARGRFHSIQSRRRLGKKLPEGIGAICRGVLRVRGRARNATPTRRAAGIFGGRGSVRQPGNSSREVGAKPAQVSPTRAQLTLITHHHHSSPYWVCRCISKRFLTPFLPNADRGRMVDRPLASEASGHPSSFILPPSSFILHPSFFILAFRSSLSFDSGRQ